MGKRSIDGLASDHVIVWWKLLKWSFQGKLWCVAEHEKMYHWMKAESCAGYFLGNQLQCCSKLNKDSLKRGSMDQSSTYLSSYTNRISNHNGQWFLLLPNKTKMAELLNHCKHSIAFLVIWSRPKTHKTKNAHSKMIEFLVDIKLQTWGTLSTFIHSWVIQCSPYKIWNVL